MDVTFGPNFAALDLRNTPEASNGAQVAENARRDRGRLEGYEGASRVATPSAPIRKEIFHRTDAGGANHYVVSGSSILLQTTTGFVPVMNTDGATVAVVAGTGHITSTQMDKRTIIL